MAGELTHDTTISVSGLRRFLEYYKGSTALKRLCEIYLEAFQDVENASWEVLYGFMLDNAVGAQLDILGRLVGELRGGKSDELYLVWIKVRIRLNRSFGRPDDVIECLKLATDKPFIYREYRSSGAFSVEFQELPDFPNDITAIVFLARAMGTNAHILFPPADGKAFRFKQLDATDDPDAGFSWGG